MVGRTRSAGADDAPSTVRSGPRTTSLGRTPQEYERLRAQARGWEAATGRLLDRVGLAPGAGCLDAGCGPGETMRLMAQRVGPAGPSVVGLDVDAALGGLARTSCARRDTGSACSAARPDRAGAVPGGPYDLVFARLLLFHLPQRVEVLRPAVGGRSRRAATWSCRTTTCAPRACCRAWPASTRWRAW